LPADFDRNVVCLLGLPFDVVDMDGAVLRIREAVAVRKPCFLSTPNLNFLIASQGDERFRDSVIHSDLNIADGMPLVWMARLLGLPIRQRVAGSNLFEALRRSDQSALPVYFYGAPPGVAEQACERLNAEAGGLRCAGFECPGFGSVEDMSSAATIDRINASGADFVVVALGARKGQAWIERNRSRLVAPVISHLGAVVDFVAGSVDRAPAWMQKAGLEWLWRIKEKPELWRRYVGDGLALLHLLTTRVLPHAWHLRRRRIGAADLDAASGEVVRSDGLAKLICRGHWSAGNVERLRPLLRLLAVADGDCEIALGEAKSIDSAIVGLLLIASGMQKRRGKRFVVSGLSSDLKRQLHWHCADFLAQDSHGAARDQDGIVRTVFN
jgi:N-acetylglucosaminyldiphosphoundecaprenol N-acetyl-beta-D-mannosaminyltransferase